MKLFLYGIYAKSEISWAKRGAQVWGARAQLVIETRTEWSLRLCEAALSAVEVVSSGSHPGSPQGTFNNV